MRRVLRLVAVLAVLAIPLVLFQLPPMRRALLYVVEVMRAGGPEGAALYFGTYAASSLFTAPIALLSGLAGYAYGPVIGVLVASPANALAATVTFLVGRFALADRIARAAGDNARWHAVQRAVELDPFRIAILLRLTPVAPQNFLSYGLSLTPITTRQFLAATWLGLLPVTIFQVYVGSLVHEAADLIEGKRPPLGVFGWVATALGLVLTIVTLVVSARLAKRALGARGVA